MIDYTHIYIYLCVYVCTLVCITTFMSFPSTTTDIHGHERHPRPLPGTSQLHRGALGALAPRKAEIRVARSSGTCGTENWGSEWLGNTIWVASGKLT
jgi:hypothetical protein